MDNKTQLKKVNPHIPGYKTLKYFIMLANKLNESRRCHARRGKRDRCIISYLNEKKLQKQSAKRSKVYQNFNYKLITAIEPLENTMQLNYLKGDFQNHHSGLMIRAVQNIQNNKRHLTRSCQEIINSVVIKNLFNFLITCSQKASGVREL